MGTAMFELTDKCRHFVSAEAVSMGNGIRGLTNKVMSWPGVSPMSGDCFVFFSRDRKQVKILRWDGDGFLLYQKRLAKGRFRQPSYDAAEGCCRLAWDDFYFLMRGLTAVDVKRDKRFGRG